MKRQWIRVAGLVAISLTAAWAQRGGGQGMSGSHGAPPSFSGASSHENSPGMGSKNTHGGSSVSNHGATSAANNATIADRVTANNGLSSKVTALLPAGMTLEAATAGFKNMGQFLAALHVSHNLNIPFDQLQKEMSSGKSLGQAIQDLSPNTNKDAVKTGVKVAETQAKGDLSGSKPSKPAKSSKPGDKTETAGS